MRRFLVRTFGFALTLLMITAAVSGLLVWFVKNNHMYLDGYGQKERLLAETPSPRIIFQGGSNVAFGIDSKAVADSVARNTINNGIIFTLGISMMMSELSEYSREGDIIVIAPEYELFYGYADGLRGAISMLTLLYPRVIKYFNTTQTFTVAKGLSGSVRYCCELFIGKIMNPESNDYTYSSMGYNAYGDEEAHWNYYPEEKIILESGLPDTFDEEYFEEFCRTLDDFEARGIDVILIPPSIYSEFYDSCKDKMTYVEDRLLKAGHPFAYPQILSVYEKSDMFDSPYHLAKSGIDKRMVLVIDALRHHIDAKNRKKMILNEE